VFSIARSNNRRRRRYEVFVRYVLSSPTIWAYDLSYNMYGALFFMAGAYTLSRNAHGDACEPGWNHAANVVGSGSSGKRDW